MRSTQSNLEKIKALKEEEKIFYAPRIKELIKDFSNIENVKELAKIFKLLGDSTMKVGELSNDLKYYTESAIFYQYAIIMLEERIKPVLLQGEELSFTEINIKENLNKLKEKMLSTVKLNNNEKSSVLVKNINDETLENKEILFELRSRVSGNIDKEKLKTLHQYVTNNIKNLLAKLYQDSEKEIGEPPCEYGVLGFGSMALEQMTPYSDLEFAILVGKKDSKITEYFTNLTHLVHLKVICLGETIISNNKYGIDLSHLVHKGINFDLGDKTPLNSMNDKWKPYNLIQTVEGMLWYLRDEQEKTSHIDMFLPHILEKTCYIHGNKQLIIDYQLQVDKFLFNELDIKGNYNCQTRALKVLDETLFELDYSSTENQGKQSTMEGNLERFRFKFSKFYTDTIDIKQEIYRIADRLLYSLGMYYRINCNNIWDTIDELFVGGLINKTAKENFIEQVNFCTNLRFKVYSCKNSHRDKVLFKGYYMDQALGVSEEQLLKYFNVTQSLNSVIRKFCDNYLKLTHKEREVFFKEHNFDDPSAIDRAHIAHRILDIPKAMNYLKSGELSWVERFQSYQMQYLNGKDTISNHNKFIEKSSILSAVNYTSDKLPWGIPQILERLVKEHLNSPAILTQYALFLRSTYEAKGMSLAQHNEAHLLLATQNNIDEILTYTKDNYLCADETIQTYFIENPKVKKVEINAYQYATCLYNRNIEGIKSLIAEYNKKSDYNPYSNSGYNKNLSSYNLDQSQELKNTIPDKKPNKNQQIKLHIDHDIKEERPQKSRDEEVQLVQSIEEHTALTDEQINILIEDKLVHNSAKELAGTNFDHTDSL